MLAIGSAGRGQGPPLIAQVRSQIDVLRYCRFLGWEPHAAQRTFLSTRSRFVIIDAGTRLGKSQGAARWAESRLLIPGTRGWNVSETYDLADKVFREVWETFERKNMLARGSSRSNQELVLRNGSWLQAKSSDHPNSLDAEGLDFAILDEAAKMPERVLYQHIRPRLSDRRGELFVISTPRGHNWFWKLWTKANDGTEPDWAAYRFPSWANTAVYPLGENDPEIVALRREYDEMGMDVLFRQEYGAEFTALEGRVYPRWNQDTMVATPSQAALGVQEVVGGVDWGFNHPAAVVIAGRTGDGQWRLLDEWVQRGKVLDEVVAELQRLTTKWRVNRWWCDPSQPGMIASCIRHGVDAAPAFNDVQPGIMTLARIMAQPGGFLVSNVCRNFIREVESYVWRGSTHKDDPVKLKDDTVDAARYAIATEEHVRGRVARSLRIQGL